MIEIHLDLLQPNAFALASRCALIFLSRITKGNHFVAWRGPSGLCNLDNSVAGHSTLVLSGSKVGPTRSVRLLFRIGTL
eukprot:scaffold8353_cov138-Cylindrotheca_fusiformis.AAC.1